MNIKFDKKEARNLGLVAASILQELRDDGEIRLQKIHSEFLRQELESLERKGVITISYLGNGLVVRKIDKSRTLRPGEWVA